MSKQRSTLLPKTATLLPKWQRCGSNIRLCRKNRSTCSIRQCFLNVLRHCCWCGRGFRMQAAGLLWMTTDLPCTYGDLYNLAPPQANTCLYFPPCLRLPSQLQSITAPWCPVSAGRYAPRHRYRRLQAFKWFAWATSKAQATTKNQHAKCLGHRSFCSKVRTHTRIATRVLYLDH